MITKLITTLALVSAFFITTPSYAEDQEVESKNVRSTISISSTRDAASGLPTGKRQHKSFKTRISTEGQAHRSAYKKCPDGTMINPGEKCPEKLIRQFQHK